MSARNAIAGWSEHAQAAAWFQALLRAIRTGDARLAALATAELRALGVDVRPVAGEPR